MRGTFLHALHLDLSR